jgi:hypothetical protein
MSEISKQALKVDNSTSFPNNTTGYISPTILRAFNVNMIDSLVEQEGYNDDSASWNVSIGALNTYTSSFAPSLTQLNAFTASQLTINTGVNGFTQSANYSIGALNLQTASFQSYTASINQIQSNGVVLGTSTRFNLVGPGTFFSASLVQNVGGTIATLTFTSDAAKVNTSSFNEYTASTAATQSVFSASVATSFSASNATFTQFSASQNNFNLSATASLVELLNLSSSLSGGYATQGELDQSASVLQANIDTKTNTSSFNEFSASQYVSNSYFATTGSNTFTGDQTLTDAAGNFFTISDVSGSLMLVAKGFTSASAHISASSAGIGNFIFKTNSNTPDTIISGSGNIFTNGAAATAGFKRYVGGSNNIINTSNLPQLSGSMQFSPSFTSNYIATAITMRGPVSSSAWTILNNNFNGALNLGNSPTNHVQGIVAGLTIANNNFNGILNVTANRTNTTQPTSIQNNQLLTGVTTLNMNSSSIQFIGNLMGGTNTINNNTTGSSRVSTQGNAFSLNQNIIMGGTTITASGSNDPNDTIDNDYNANVYRNLILGNSNAVQLQSASTGSNSLTATSILGNNLIVTGSSPGAQFNSNLPAIYGSAFVGRFNDVSGNKALSAQTIFAVGTGTSTTRKTGFLIDSGSNSYFEGSVTTSGSVYGNIVTLSVASQTASMDLTQGNFFTLDLVSGSTTHLTATNIRPGQTVNVLLTQPSVGTGSVSYNSTFDFPAGGNYVATPITSSKDIITFITFDTATIYATSINNLG